jgi:hypothetical protein
MQISSREISSGRIPASGGAHSMSLEEKGSRFLFCRQTVEARELFCVFAIYAHSGREHSPGVGPV